MKGPAQGSREGILVSVESITLGRLNVFLYLGRPRHTAQKAPWLRRGTLQENQTKHTHWSKYGIWEGYDFSLEPRGGQRRPREKRLHFPHGVGQKLGMWGPAEQR